MEGVGGGPLHNEFQNDSELELVFIEDWEKENPLRDKTTSPPKSNIKPLRLERNHGKDTGAFYSECQRRGVTPEHRFNEIAKGCFEATLLIDGRFFDKTVPYASIRDAKEAVCRKALRDVERLGFGEKEGPNRRRKSSDLNSLSNELALPAGIDDENWIHILNGFAQSNKIDYPDYEFSEAAPWTCTLRFANTTLGPFETQYGSFAKKDTAKKAVAMAAVTYLRANGKFTSTPSRNPSTPRPVASPRLSREASENSVASDGVSTPRETYAFQVFELARELGFQQPRFEVVRLEGNFVDESARFVEIDVRYEPRLAGVHGQVSRVFGKKVAHEECCRLVLEVLEEIRRSRLQ